MLEEQSSAGRLVIKPSLFRAWRDIEAQERYQLIQELAASVNSRGRTHR